MFLQRDAAVRQDQDPDLERAKVVRAGRGYTAGVEDRLTLLIVRGPQIADDPRQLVIVGVRAANQGAASLRARLEPLQDEVQAADAVREHWKLGRGPIRDLSAIMELHGFILVREIVSCPDMDAVSCWQAGRPYVLFSAEVTSGPRNAYNLAHEMAHIVLHSEVEVNSDNIGRIERQADRFASSFLLPQETFSREVLGTSLNHFLFLKEKWGVSIAAMAYRCKDLDIMNTNQYSYVMRQLNLKKIRKHEPMDEQFKVREPSVLGESMKMLIDNGVQSKGKVEESLSLSLADVEKLCGLPEGHLESAVVHFRPRLL